MTQSAIDHVPIAPAPAGNSDTAFLSIVFWSVLGITTLLHLIYALKLPLTGDEAYLYENIVKSIPIGTCYNVGKNRLFIKGLNKSIKNVFTFHDPSIVPTGEQYKVFSF